MNLWTSSAARTQPSVERIFRPADATAPFPYQEAYKTLRTNLKFMALGGDYRRILVTGAIQGEGKSSVSANLALALAETENRVLLIDCDLRKPILHRYLRLQRRQGRGLLGALAGMPLENCIQHAARYNIDVMTVDFTPPNPTELLGSPKMKQLLEQLAAQYDYLILDAPPAAVVTDAAVLSQYSDGVLLVIRQRYATFQQVRRAVENLRQVNANILGAVLNSYRPEGPRAERELYTYYYSEHPHRPE